MLIILVKSSTGSTAELPFTKGGNKFKVLSITCKTLMSSLCNLILKKNLKLLFLISTIEKQPFFWSVNFSYKPF